MEYANVRGMTLDLYENYPGVGNDNGTGYRGSGRKEIVRRHDDRPRLGR